MIEEVHRKENVILGNFVKLHFLWKELPDQAVHVFISSAFPRAVGMSKEEIDVNAFRDARKRPTVPPIISNACRAS